MQHGNELIDSKVKILFDQLLYSKKNYYIGPDKCGGVLFNIDDTDIKLTWFKKSKSTQFSNDPITISNFSFTGIPYWEVYDITTVDEIFKPRYQVRRKGHNDYIQIPEKV